MVIHFLIRHYFLLFKMSILIFPTPRERALLKRPGWIVRSTFVFSSLYYGIFEAMRRSSSTNYKGACEPTGPNISWCHILISNDDPFDLSRKNPSRCSIVFYKIETCGTPKNSYHPLASGWSLRRE